MKIKVNIYLGDRLIEPSDLHSLTVKSDTIDRIVNDITDNRVRQINEDKAS
ncbi:MAG: hypothetical protein ACI4GY_10060 [Acutalibacteraceae bacterium]